MVTIPFKNGDPSLGKSKSIGLKRLAGVEARLSRSAEQRKMYEQFMEDYEGQHHMEEVTGVDLNSEDATYLPHHPVIRQSALTTKLRVVFDASAKTENGRSLNDEQLIGPVVQDDLATQLIRFRLFKVAINADIQAMYRQIWITEEQQDLQRILWRRKPEDRITAFKLRTVTYGTASAPYLATRCLNQIAEDVQKSHPRGSKIIRNNFYVDDLLAGADSVKEAAEIYQEVSSVLMSYGMPLRKWASNNECLIDSIKGDNNGCEFLTNPESTVKTLGIKWDRQKDTLSFKVKLQKHQTITKRSLLSEIASIYDPLGFAAPVTITAKRLYQEVWVTGTGWDEPLKEDILSKYQAFRQELPNLEKISIPRWTQANREASLELHGFSDASEKAYAAVVYLRVKRHGKFYSNILAAKTRVAPLKTVSLPRLELLGAVLLTQVVVHVKLALQLPNIPTYCWSDSTITLAWIHGLPSKFKTFVANRIATIQEQIPPEHWRHVGTKENPADFASRGIMPSELKSLQLWFHGPEWLQREFTPASTTIPDTTEEMKKIQVLHVKTTLGFQNITEKFSAYHRLIIFTAFIMRCKRNFTLRKQNEATISGPFTVKEREDAFLALCSQQQQLAWPKEFDVLSSKSTACEDPSLKKSKIFQFHPFFDSTAGVIRIGGRLRHADLAYDQKYPIIMPDCSFSRLYLSQLHTNTLHSGPTLLLATARQKMWIIGGKKAARQVIKKCNVCTRWKGTTMGQVMGDLPADRTKAYRAFHTTGVDYCGPVKIKARKGRKAPTYKAWIAVFVCFSTNACHLEPVSDLTTEAFIAALRRFVSRRGKPAVIQSDNGTNFVGADKELRTLLAQEKSQAQVVEIMAREGITWKFIPPGSPHFGGLWEAAVKSAKYHLRRIFHEAFLSYEELATVLCQIEAQLNSRPLCPLNEDSMCLNFLTPGHFLIFSPLNAVADPDLAEIPTNRLSRWQFCQHLVQSFWKRWSTEYLSGLQQRNKWQEPQENAYKGQLVIIKEDNQPPQRWKTGVVAAVYPCDDDNIRVVTVRTAEGEYDRAIVKLIPLYKTEQSGPAVEQS